MSRGEAVEYLRKISACLDDIERRLRAVEGRDA